MEKKNLPIRQIYLELNIELGLYTRIWFSCIMALVSEIKLNIKNHKI